SAGKRDFKKRIMFGQLADKYCDMIILTEDDPRDEDVFQIAQEIAEGIKKKNHIIIEDRYNAIRQAIEMATANDTILILGKGDEAFIYREFGREEYRGDQNVAKDMIKRYYFKEEIN
ncbi:MAG: UDP-N-acetylmuramoyl-L-alanyl-D-glutamate--2,6-diaminopimelate ligase, partial [Erysipelotrichaceae bacterium]|nr:UDP-N-acetylmuramoyl-L-alanyl-D-glutamate--2,6-diaminopimelate ligase [Erysipelotrichaceae bacterium]